MRKVLVVDDNDIMRDTIKDILNFEGFEVDTAQGGNEATILLAKNNYNLIITDILMPERDGYDLINIAKTNYPSTKVIAISGGGYISSDAYLDMATNAGADGVLSKPFDVDKLISMVLKVLEIENIMQ
jgi:CheY-like chemotaxis protein